MVTPDTQPTGRPNARMRQTVGDMVRSMLVVLAFVAVLLLVTWRPQPDAVKPVDTTSAVTLATMQADFPVEVAVGLSDGWRPTSARWEPTEKSDGETGIVRTATVRFGVTSSDSLKIGLVWTWRYSWPFKKASVHSSPSSCSGMPSRRAHALVASG